MPFIINFNFFTDRRNILNSIQQKTSELLCFDQGIDQLTKQLAEKLTGSLQKQVSVIQKKWDEGRAKSWSNRGETVPLDTMRKFTIGGTNVPFILLDPKAEDTYHLSFDRALNQKQVVVAIPYSSGNHLHFVVPNFQGILAGLNAVKDGSCERDLKLNRVNNSTRMEEKKVVLNRNFEENDPNRISKLKSVIEHDLRVSFPEKNIQIDEIGFNQVEKDLPEDSDKELSKIKTSLFVEEALYAKNYNICVKNNNKGEDSLFYKDYVWIWVKPNCEKEFSLVSISLISDSELDLQETLAKYFKPL